MYKNDKPWTIGSIPRSLEPEYTRVFNCPPPLTRGYIRITKPCGYTETHEAGCRRQIGPNYVHKKVKLRRIGAFSGHIIYISYNYNSNGIGC